jgi:hypothetical protein
MIDVLLRPAVLIGFVLGVAAAAVFHWLAPPGTDTSTAGAWFVGLGCLAGVLWSLAFRKHDR